MGRILAQGCIDARVIDHSNVFAPRHTAMAPPGLASPSDHRLLLFELMMPHDCAFHHVDYILGNVGGVIADAFQLA